MGVILGVVVIGIFALSIINTNLKENKDTWFGIVDVSDSNCDGDARCISGTVTMVIDGDTIKVSEQSIRFALASTPELNEVNGVEAKNFIESICPPGSSVLVDEDDGQPDGSYDRMVGMIHCNGVNLNQAILDAGYGTISKNFCSKSEFSNEVWAKKTWMLNEQFS